MTDPRSPSAYEVLHVRDDAPHAVIEGAYRALARLYHPDRTPSAAASHRMGELNRAYAMVRTSELREVYDRIRSAVAPQGDPPPVPASPGPPRSPEPDVLNFGRYAGWSLRDLAHHDRDYLRWLSRHSSGIRHRRQILELLAMPNGVRAPQRFRR